VRGKIESESGALVNFKDMAGNIQALVGRGKVAAFRPDGGLGRPVIELAAATGDGLTHVSIHVFKPRRPILLPRRQASVSGVTLTLNGGVVTDAHQSTDTRVITRSGEITRGKSPGSSQPINLEDPSSNLRTFVTLLDIIGEQLREGREIALASNNSAETVGEAKTRIRGNTPEAVLAEELIRNREIF
jgi:hypothetical protein